jgi:hypothetical protein
MRTISVQFPLILSERLCKDTEYRNCFIPWGIFARKEGLSNLELVNEPAIGTRPKSYMYVEGDRSSQLVERKQLNTMKPTVDCIHYAAIPGVVHSETVLATCRTVPCWLQISGSNQQDY